MVEHHSIMSPAERDAFGHWLSGFADGEGSFQLDEKNGYSHVRFSIMLRRDDKPILEAVRRYWGVGVVADANHTGRDMVVYRVTGTEDCAKVVVPHFDGFPLVAKKRRDFAIWRDAVDLSWNIRSTRPHKGKSGTSRWSAAETGEFKRLLGLLRAQKKFDPGWRIAEPPPFDRRALVPGPERDVFGSWLAGFVAGEGCFSLGLQKLSGTPTAAFSIRLRSDDKPALLDIQRFLGVGRVDDLRPDARCHPCSTYVVTKIPDLATVVAPLFEAYPLHAKKADDFTAWKQAVAIAASVRDRGYELIDRDATGRAKGTRPRWPGAGQELSLFKGLLEQLRSGRKYEHAS